MRTLTVLTLLACYCLFVTPDSYSTTVGTNNPNPENEDNWYDDLDWEFLSPRVISAGLDGNPKMRLRLTNNGDQALNNISFRFFPDEETQQFSGCATFPNGGYVNLEPGESTIISAWSQCYFGDGLQLPEGTSNHIANFVLEQDGQQFTAVEEFQIINDRERSGPEATDGQNMTIAGTITLGGGYSPLVDLFVKTAQSQEFQVSVQSTGLGTYAFEFMAQQRDDWYLVVKVNDGELEGVNFPNKTVKVASFEEANDINIEINSLDYRYNVNFELSSAINTPTGFWRGAVSESEETVAFIPGQENWREGNGKTADEWKAEATIFKYDFEGNMLWSYKPGYECWGGDMAPDGSKVVYQLVPNGGTYSVGVLDGSTGELMWKKEFTEFNPIARALEGLEASFSNDGSLVAVGTVPTGVVTLIDSETGDFVRQVPNAPDGEENWGQIRSLRFDSNDEYLYVGSGDNYLRKVKVSDGSVAWRAFIGGWPFVNGFEFSSDGSFIVTGTKSFDQAMVDVQTGETMWINDTGSLEAALSANDQYVINFWGDLMDAQTGEYLAFLRQGAESHFFANDELVAKMDRNIAVSYLSGKRLHDSQQSGGGLGGGEQSQWSYMSADGTLAIIAYRDFVTTPGDQVGIAFYTGSIERESIDPNNAPTDIALSASTLDENNEMDSEVGTLTATDEDTEDMHTFELIEGEGDDDNELFEIDDDVLEVGSVLDFEVKSSYSVRIRAIDNQGAAFEKSFNISVNDINDNPESISLDATDIDENTAAGATIGALSTVDDDAQDTHSYSLVSGDGDTDNGSFTIEGSSLKTTDSFDFESQSSLSIRVQTDDGNGGTFAQTFTIVVNDVNEAPTDISLSSSSVDEGQDAGAEVGTLSTTDEDTQDSFTYALVTGTGDDDNDQFDISGNSLVTTASFDVTTQSSYSIRVQVTDSGQETFEKQFNITVEEVIVTGLEPDPQLITDIFPNPGSDFVQVNLATQNYPFDLKMYDLNGSLKSHAAEIFTDSIRIDVRNVSRGIYIIMVKDNDGGITRKKLMITK